MFTNRSSERAGTIGWLAMLVALAACLGMAFVPSPYVVETPGPTFDTLGETTSGELISIADAPTYPTSGELTLLTVSLRGNPEQPLTWLEVAGAYVNPSNAIIPMDAAYRTGETIQQSNDAGRIEMQNSQQAAVAAALLYEGFDVTSDVTIAQVLPGTPADGVLRAGDRVVTVNGETAYDVFSIRASIARSDGPAAFAIVRDGVEQTIDVTPRLEAGARFVGIVPQNTFTFPISVDIELPNVGGPSAGMMFALGIVDKLTEGAMTGGVDWAGTGTIGATGDVGPIGGIVQKMYGAVASGATWFLAPAANCGEVAGNVPDGLRVVRVETLDDAVRAIETVAAGGDTASLPTCEPAP